MKRKHRPHLPKVPEGVDQRGTVPLGQDPGVGPYGPRAQILAAGAVARALRSGTTGQRKVALVLVAVMAITFLLAAVAALSSRS